MKKVLEFKLAPGFTLPGDRILRIRLGYLVRWGTAGFELYEAGDRILLRHTGEWHDRTIKVPTSALSYWITEDDVTPPPETPKKVVGNQKKKAQ